MSFEDLMGAVHPKLVAIEALAAIGAELELKLSATEAPPAVVDALRAVSAAAGVGDLDELPPPQQAIALALVRTYVRQAVEILDNPAREPGWTFTDPAILDGWGRGSTMVPTLLAGAPELQHVESFLDVGTGVGLLAVAAASVWPDATIVGIDIWEPSLDRARNNVKDAGLEERITLRTQNVVDLDDVDRYDCAWVPTFFLTEPTLVEALPHVLAAVRPGGWIVLGRLASLPDPLAEATLALRTIRGGGQDLAIAATELLEQAGCVAVHTLPRAGGVPLEFVIGQRPLG